MSDHPNTEPDSGATGLPKPSPTNEKRPAEAGRQAGDTIPGGAGETGNPRNVSSQAKKGNNQPSASRVIAYIDGFNLYFGMKSKGWKRYYWLDLPALCRELLKPGQSLEATKYFTSRVSPTQRDPHQGKRQGTYLEALEAHSGIKAIYGHYLPKPVKCHQCKSTWQTFEEKRTDVNIAIEMLADAHADQFDTALLISADSDLSAPIEKIRSLYPSKRVIAAFPPDRHSDQLKRLVHGSFTIGEAKLRKSQLPDPVFKANGFALVRPKGWQ